MKLSLTLVKSTLVELAMAKKLEAETKIAVPEPVLNDKQSALKTLMEVHGHHFGCQEVTVRNMLEILSDAPKDSFRKKPENAASIYPIGCMIVPVANPNSHNYALNQPVLYWGDFRGLRSKGTIGNLLPFERKEWLDAMRLATEDEIKAYAEAIDPAALPHLMDLMGRIPELSGEAEE